ncbi:MAG TPA: flagellar basal body-associated FliL family protein [Sphingomonadales bacterium]
MSETDDLNGDLGEDLASGLQKKKLSGREIVMYGGAALLVLLLGLVLWLTLAGGDDAAEPVAVAEPRETLFYELPELLVNLNTGGRKASYLKITVALEVDRRSAIAQLDAKLPRVIDDFQIYLRELRLEDLNGSAGMFRLKEELLSRVNTSVYPTEVKDVLFKEMLVQ